ncbi:hypothetical protein BDN70DRAFT_982803 [Pholiota conissans]|uniref:Uncharacterized protein n=1 Tax=Pholiota conissans TaxID=109636 RepID=A0A9P5Z1F2_9AGAR|nr:hypothetical protein BDN70DRAFT_982803 [Pholiota conissans]
MMKNLVCLVKSFDTNIRASVNLIRFILYHFELFGQGWDMGQGGRNVNHGHIHWDMGHVVNFGQSKYTYAARRWGPQTPVTSVLVASKQGQRQRPSKRAKKEWVIIFGHLRWDMGQVSEFGHVHMPWDMGRPNNSKWYILDIVVSPIPIVLSTISSLRLFTFSAATVTRLARGDATYVNWSTSARLNTFGRKVTGILFAEDADEPRMVQFNTLSGYTQTMQTWQTINMHPYLPDNEKKGRASVQLNGPMVPQGRITMGLMSEVFYRKDNNKGSSKLNRCVKRLTGGMAFRWWSGPFIMLRRTLFNTFYDAVMERDLPMLLRFFAIGQTNGFATLEEDLERANEQKEIARYEHAWLNSID